jgi:hypothetical protein
MKGSNGFAFVCVSSFLPILSVVGEAATRLHANFVYSLGTACILCQQASNVLPGSLTAGEHLMYGVHLTRHLLQDSDALATTTEVASAGESCDERLSQ